MPTHEASPETRRKVEWKKTLGRWRGETAEIDLEPFYELTRDIAAEATQLATESD